MRTRLVVRDASAETAALFGDTLEKMDGQLAQAEAKYAPTVDTPEAIRTIGSIGTHSWLAAFRGLVLGGKYDEAEAIVRQLAAVGADVDAALQKDAALNAGFATRLADTITAANRTGFWVVVLIGVASHSGRLAAGMYHHHTGT